jgi:hypothetical protein
MSKVATTERGESLIIPHRLHDFWTLTITGSSLNDKLEGFLITAQRAALGGNTNTQDLYGGVETKATATMLGLMDGSTVVNDSGQQTVSFEIMLNNEHYYFIDGVLSADGSQINGGSIRKNFHDFEPDGSWSATASGGPPAEKPGKGKGREQGHHRN